MHPNPLEKRKHIRLDSRIPMRYRKIEPNTREFKGSLMRNISEGGTRMTLYEFLPLNSKLALEIPMVIGTKPVQGTGRVAWVRKAPFGEQYDAGVEFINLDQGDPSRITKFIFDRTIERAR